MNFVDISTLGITTELEALKRDTQSYSLYMYQHQGTLFTDNSRIGNFNQKEAHTKFNKILNKAIEKNIALVISPEYSCPKSIINKIIEEEDFRPAQSKLWVLGGESLNKEELNTLRKIENDTIHIHFEDNYTTSDKSYVDPLYYIFKGTHEGKEKLIILIQFKSRHMGGLWNSQLEPKNLIEGNDVYIIKNDDVSVRLVSFICSQAMNFDASFEEDLTKNHSWVDSPYLIINVQFNPDPSHEKFINFKKFALQKEKRELITLNWGKKTNYETGGSSYCRYNTPRSGIYFKSSDLELDYSPTKIIDNHNKGLYFLQIERSKRVYFLKGEIDLFKLENKAVHISEGVEQQQRREGPSIMNIYNFSYDLNIEEILVNVPDKHIDFLESRGVKNEYLLNPNNTIVNKERLLNISTGKVNSKKGNKWAEIINLYSFILDSHNECNNRITYIEDTYSCSEQVRGNNCTNIFELDTNILSNSLLYPHSIKHLKDKDISLGYAENAHLYNYKYNVVNKEKNGIKATICYIGSSVGREEVERRYDELQKLFEIESPGKNTVVVYYKIGNEVKYKSNPNAGSITKTSSEYGTII